MRVLVTGGRDFSDRNFLFKAMDFVHAKRQISTVIEGGAAGADSMSRSWAKSRDIETATYEADWELYRGRAGLVRNCKMLRDGRPRLVIAFAGGRGTAHMVRIAKEAGVGVLETWKYKDGQYITPQFS